MAGPATGPTHADRRAAPNMTSMNSMETRSPSMHVADSHDLIRVHGARANNLKDVSIEIPKRRLTVFTGVSGSGKSSLVFDTIAAESQRMINETYSAFVQGFMPTLDRPDVDVLDGLTTAIIVDQERLGANVRSTVGTATDANAMLRILFSRLGQPHIGPPIAFSFNVPTRKASGVMSTEKASGRVEKSVVRDVVYMGGMCPRCEGMGAVSDFDLTALYDDEQVAQRGRAHDPRLRRGRLVRPHLRRLRLPGPGQANSRVHTQGTRRPPVQGAHQDQGGQHQPDLRGSDPENPEIVPVQGRRRAAAAHPRLRGASGHVHHLSRVRRHPAQRDRPLIADPRDRHRRGLRDADQRPGRVGAGSGRAVRRAAACEATAHPGLVRRDRAGLPLTRPTVGHALGRRGAARQDDPPPGVVAHRRHVRLRRADDRAAPARHRNG